MRVFCTNKTIFMKNRLSIIAVVAVCLSTLGSSAVFAQAYKKPDVVWTQNMNGRTGLYTHKTSAVAQAMSLTLDAVYYYGDMEKGGINGIHPENIGGVAKINYAQPLNEFFNLRYSIGLGYLRGDNSNYLGEDEPADRLRSFNSLIAQASVGAEFFPIPGAGLFIYAGVLLNYSHPHQTYTSRGTLYNRETNCFLPMIPIEIGYQFNLTRSWLMNVHLGVVQGVCDVDVFSLDGWPINMNIPHTENKWADGYFNIGITLAYTWHNCETCRLIRW